MKNLHHFLLQNIPYQSYYKGQDTATALKLILHDPSASSHLTLMLLPVPFPSLRTPVPQADDLQEYWVPGADSSSPKEAHPPCLASGPEKELPEPDHGQEEPP